MVGLQMPSASPRQHPCVMPICTPKKAHLQAGGVSFRYLHSQRVSSSCFPLIHGPNPDHYLQVQPPRHAQ